ncbi:MULTISPECIES: aldolase/citrate lyase family protein [Alistipes]|jgi:2-keto-3-deoxy-L-rhamnonate aldolase RhmA|uniref:aldolase/citrate lyase family protein n=1 Tax=Alistipes TaxID=239759 RepID=UPI001B690C72|nr:MULTISPECIES: aldolase/citrate lyase family protein [Alistipes]MBP3528569.1 aldolase [Alistipes sp.]
MLNLMYITKHPEIARIAEEAGVDWIFVDMEFIGKDCRQGGLDTVQNHHTVEDVANIRAAVTKAKVLVRINPIHDTMDDYPSSEEEIEAVIQAGADIVMLPYFKTTEEVHRFIGYVGGRAKTCLLVETPEAADLLDQIVEIDGIDMIHIGLNDMHLALKMKFMFQLLTDGSVDKWTRIIAQKGIMYGFGGLASLNGGAVPGRMILKEHYRLGSQMVIVSRAFCNTDNMTDLDKVRSIFNNGIADIRKMENEMNKLSKEDFKNNHKAVCDAVGIIVKK